MTKKKKKKEKIMNNLKMFSNFAQKRYFLIFDNLGNK